MNKRILSSILVLGLFVLTMLSSPINAEVNAAAHVADITITAGADGLSAKMPITISADDLSSYSVSLATAVVKSGTTELPTQYDSELEELVFQLPAAEAASGSASFELWADTTGTSNGQSASNINVTDSVLYNETYSNWLPSKFTATYYNATAGNEVPNIDGFGEVAWMESDWGIVCVGLGTSWRNGAVKHIVMKDQLWDAVGQNYNASSGDWRWNSWAFQEADPGWVQGGVDPVNSYKSGPVRGILQTTTQVGYQGYLGPSVPDLNLTRTYMVYNGIPGLAQRMTLTSNNATLLDIATTDFLGWYGSELVFKTQTIDANGWAGTPTSTGGQPLSETNNISTLYGPGNGILPRSNPPGGFNMSLLNDNYYGAYNDSNFGFVFNYGQYPGNVTAIEIGDQVFLGTWYKFSYFPAEGLNRYFIPFSGGSVTGDVTDHIDDLNNMWDADYSAVIAAYVAPTTTTTVPVTTTTTTTSGAPGFKLIVVFAVAASMLVYRKKR